MIIDYKLIGTRIKEARRNSGCTQSDLASKLDVTVGYVSQVERGVTKISLELLGKISVALKCNIVELFIGSTTVSRDYLADEICSKMDHLDSKDKKLVFDFIDLLRKS